MIEMLSDLHPAIDTAAYLFGERHLIRTAGELLIASGLDHDAVASKAYWRQDQAQRRPRRAVVELNLGASNRTPVL
jgi:NADPH-dependent ferric siderophore reductase